MAASNASPTIFIAGASRGLGHAMAAEFAARGWNVIGTVRDPAKPTPLRELAERNPRVAIERLDIDDEAEIAALRGRLAGASLDILFVNAGTTTRDQYALLRDVERAEFVRVMVTNAWSPMRVIEALADLVPADGMIGAMSSGQGSLANNTGGLREVYRASKAALNMAMKSAAAHEENAGRALVLMAPGWVKTDLGGPDARLTVEESIPSLVDVLLAKRARPGLEYLDYQGRTVPW